MPHVKSGKLRAIGVTSKQRSRSLPDVIPMAEQGWPDFDVRGWFELARVVRLPDSDRLWMARAAQIARDLVREPDFEDDVVDADEDGDGEADVAGGVGVDQVFGWGLKARGGGQEFLPVVGSG